MVFLDKVRSTSRVMFAKSFLFTLGWKYAVLNDITHIIYGGVSAAVFHAYWQNGNINFIGGVCGFIRQVSIWCEHYLPQTVQL